jgi:hypothetical protein
LNQAIVGPTFSTWFASEYKKSGKKLDMGKACVCFKSLEDLALDVVGRTVARVSAQEHMAKHKSSEKHLRESDERPPSHVPPFFLSVIHAESNIR